MPYVVISPTDSIKSLCLFLRGLWCCCSNSMKSIFSASQAFAAASLPVILMSPSDVADDRRPTTIRRGWLQISTSYRSRSRSSRYFFEAGKYSVFDS